VTSSQPVVTQTAINFTPDNLRAYAYSGLIEVDDNETTLLEFDTNSEYIKGKVNFFYSEVISNDRFEYFIYLNDIVIVQYHVFGPSDSNGEHKLPSPIPIIIPPFTNVKLKASNTENTNSRKQCAIFSGKAIGMTETGFQ